MYLNNVFNLQMYLNTNLFIFAAAIAMLHLQTPSLN